MPEIGIEGIPFYYRQFGYAYAIDHAASDSLPTWRIPNSPQDDGRYALRPATIDDAEILTGLYAQAMAPLALHTERSAEEWRFLLQWAQAPARLIEDRHERRIVGYATISPLRHGGFRVSESGLADHAAAMALLRHLKTEASGEIQIAWPATGLLVQAARHLGSTPIPSDQWLLRITDGAGLLTRIAPAFEQRLAASDCAGLTADVIINIFRRAFRLRFVDGRITAVEDAGFVDASMGADGGDLCIPPDAFVRLICGYRTLDELRDAWPDIVVKATSRRLLNVLFPRLDAYFHMPYFHYG